MEMSLRVSQQEREEIQTPVFLCSEFKESFEFFGVGYFSIWHSNSVIFL